MNWDEEIELTSVGKSIGDLSAASPMAQEILIALRELCALKGTDQVTKRELYDFMQAKKA